MMTDAEILDVAHRMAWRYKKSSDPHHSDTYTFNATTMVDFARRVMAAAASEENREYYCKKHAPSLQWEVADCQIWFFLLILPSSIVSYPFILFIRVKL